MLLSGSAFAVSGNWSNVKTRTYTIDRTPRYSDVSILIRKEWKGVYPKVVRKVGTTYHLKFVYRNQLQRVKAKFRIVKKTK